MPLVRPYIRRMKKEIRRARTYKATDSDYKKAMKRAKAENVPLAKMIEEVIFAYGDGAFSVQFTKPQSSIYVTPN